jgi:hypothetical protein
VLMAGGGSGGGDGGGSGDNDDYDNDGDNNWILIYSCAGLTILWPITEPAQNLYSKITQEDTYTPTTQHNKQQKS